LGLLDDELDWAEFALLDVLVLDVVLALDVVDADEVAELEPKDSEYVVCAATLPVAATVSMTAPRCTDAVRYCTDAVADWRLDQIQ
jgi:hypothetical protein